MVKNIISWGVVASILLLTASPSAGEQWVSPLEGVELRNQISGPKITAEAAKGRVVFFVYWGVACPECRKSFPYLVTVHKKYWRTRKFLVIASHVRTDIAVARNFCAQQRVTFPVYNKLALPKAPPGAGVPLAYLFDHTGKVVASGHPTKLYPKIPPLVKEAMKAKPPTEQSPMLKGVELKYFKYLQKTLLPGRNIRATVNQLKLKSNRRDKVGQEAKAVLESVEEWIRSEVAKFEALSTTRPAAALIRGEVLSKTLRGMPEGQEVDEILRSLHSDRNVGLLAPIVKSANELRERLSRHGPTKATEREAAAIKARIESFLRRKNLSPQVTDEARRLIESLEEKEEEEDEGLEEIPRIG